MITKANAVEAAHDLQRAEVVWHVELVDGIGCVEDEIERKVVWLLPVLVAGANEFFGTHLKCIFLFARAVREDVDFCSEGNGE